MRVQEQVIRAWQEAALALDIEVIAPFAAEADEGTIHAGALIVGFGSPKGTLIAPMDLEDWDRWSDGATANGCYFSMLNPKSYSKFDRRRFEDTLNDWSWQGDPERRPTWYVGPA